MLHIGMLHIGMLKICGYFYYVYIYNGRKFVGSISDGDIGIFHRHNPSGLTIALGSTQPLTEMSTRNISWG